jgi:hypothetical protein
MILNISFFSVPVLKFVCEVFKSDKMKLSHDDGGGGGDDDDDDDVISLQIQS